MEYLKRVIFLVLLTSSVYLNGQTYTTTQDGDWNTASTWVGGVVPPITSAGQFQARYYNVNHAVTWDGAMDFATNGSYPRDVIVNSGGSLYVRHISPATDGDLTTMNGSRIHVKSGGFLTTDGDLNLTGTITYTNSIMDGLVTVGGNFNMNLNGAVNVHVGQASGATARLTVGGNYHSNGNLSTMTLFGHIVVASELRLSGGSGINAQGSSSLCYGSVHNDKANLNNFIRSQGAGSLCGVDALWYHNSTATDIGHTATPANGMLFGSNPCAAPAGCGCAAVVAGSIGGGTTICAGGTTGLTSTADASGGNGSSYTYQWETRFNGGAWGNASGTSTNSTYTTAALAAGTHEFRRVATSGSCGSSTTASTVTVTATAAPSAGTLSGTTEACVAGNTTFSSTVGGGTWTSATPAVATIVGGTGVITGVDAGTSVMTYTVAGGVCPDATDTRTVTITETVAGTLSGTTEACVGGNTTFSSTVGGGTWASATPAVATIVGGTGVITGVGAGTSVMTYTVTGTGGCSDVTDTRTVTITAPPSAGTLSGNTAICVAGNTTFSSTVGGGTWTSATPAVATVAGGTGVITGVSAGTSVMTYTVTGTGGCADVTDTRTVTVTAPATAGTLSGTTTVCVAGNVTFSSDEGGGTWTSATPAVATIVGGTGVITGVAAGTSVMTYTVTGTGGCADATDTRTVTVQPTIAPGTIAGGATICNGASTDLTSGSAATGGDGASYAYQWETSFNGGAWGNATGTGNGTIGNYTTGALAEGTHEFRRAVTSGECTGVTATQTVVVAGSMTSGTIGSAQTINAGATPSGLTEIVAHTGGVATYVYLWESSTDNATWAAAAGTNNAATYSPGALSIDTWYRRTVTSGGGCGAATSASVKITVEMNVCSGVTPSTMNNTTAATQGGAGTPAYQWEVSTDNQSTWSDAGGTDNQATYDPGAVTQDIWYRRKATINGCVGYSNVLKAGLAAGSPGGIGDVLVWLKADAGTSNLSAQWDDQSGNGNHYTTATGGVDPVLVVGGDSSSNYNPYISISNRGFNAPLGAALGANYTMFAVAKKLSSGTSGVLFDGHSNGYSFAFANAGDTVKKVTVVTSATLSANGIQVDINEGYSDGYQGCDAHVYELIIYNRVLASDSIAIIESYLETKYGIEDSDNYLSSIGGKIFDVATAGSYVNDVIGIGRECYFHQKQAITLDDSLTITVSSTGSLSDLKNYNSLNTQSITNDVSYLMVSSNGGVLKGTGATAADIPPNGTAGFDATPISISSRIDREWLITNTNFSDMYAMKFEVIPTGLDPDDLVLMVDDDGDFTDCGIAAGTGLYSNGDGSGITISIGSIDVEGVGPAIIPAGGKAFLAIASKDPATVLPVELTSFTVVKDGETNIVSWVTQAEINSSHFNVEKSTDGINWEILEVVQAAGNSMNEIRYTVVDYDLCASKCYYRLHQVDLDGTSDFSEVVVMENAVEPVTDLIIYPVPVQETAAVEFSALYTGAYNVDIINSTGAKVYDANVVCVEGQNEFNINTSSYAHGVYFLMIRDREGKVINKVRFTK